MGYETTLVVVNKGVITGFCDYYASFDLCKIGGFDSSVFSQKLDGFFFFPGDGNRRVETDEYGASLSCAELGDAIDWLENIYVDHVDYRRRIAPPLAYLKELKKHADNLEIVVVHYGH